MGKKSAPHPSRGWVIRYAGGGPLDGAVLIRPQPIQGHHIPVEDGPFQGHQCYDIVAYDEQVRVIELEYSGERWGPKLEQ